MPPKKKHPDKMKIADLVLDERNARKGKVDAIVDSLTEFGQHRQVVVQAGTNKVIAGNHLVRAASVLGWTEVEVKVVDDDDEKATRRNLADNLTSTAGTYDYEIMKELTDEVGTDIPGMDEATLKKLADDEKTATEEPVYPLLAKPGEHYDYVMFFTESDVDALFIEEVFGQKWRDWKHVNRPPIRSRLLPVKVLREALEAAGAIPAVSKSQKS